METTQRKADLIKRAKTAISQGWSVSDKANNHITIISVKIDKEYVIVYELSDTRAMQTYTKTSYFATI